MSKAEALQALRERLLQVHCDIPELPPVPGEGSPEASVVLIGHSPGGTDAQKGRPYTGPNGQLFDQLLGEAGLNRSQFFITNLVKCWCWKEENGIRVNRYPSAREIKEWVPVWLREELEIIQPRAIVCLGNVAAQHFLGKDFKISQQSGQWHTLPEGSPYLKLAKTAYHPRPVVMAIIQANYLMHLQAHAPQAYPDARANLVADLIKVKRFLSGETPGINSLPISDKLFSSLERPAQNETIPDKSSGDYSDTELDRNLEQTFPASDPIPISGQATPMAKPRPDDALEPEDKEP